MVYCSCFILANLRSSIYFFITNSLFKIKFLRAFLPTQSKQNYTAFWQYIYKTVINVDCESDYQMRVENTIQSLNFLV